jgi:hypothetical protein
MPAYADVCRRMLQGEDPDESSSNEGAEALSPQQQQLRLLRERAAARSDPVRMLTYADVCADVCRSAQPATATVAAVAGARCGTVGSSAQQRRRPAVC